MVFSSSTFLFFFLPIVVAVSLVVPFKNLWLLIASLVFYLWGGGTFIFLLLTSIMVNWALGLAVGDAAYRPEDPGHGRLRRRICITLSVLVNVGLLAWFKYANFAAAQIDALVRAFDPAFEGLGIQDIVLPIGISFFTFQAMSYVLDVASGRARVLRNPIDFALYVSLFPQLIAGPIVRFHEIEQQLRDRSVTLDGFATGVNRFALGLVKKVVVADSVAVLADAAFSGDGSLPVAGAWVGILAYTIQIFFDFSGYTDMAIGMGQMLGFTFPENFRRPYSALSVTDFWRRWHMTLSHWFRDYVYIPLGGNRHGTFATYRNLAIVFLITGLWHGANWTFVVWGIYHGAWLIFERVFGTGVSEEPDPLMRVIRRATTLLIVMIGWVIFRADSIAEAGAYIGSLLGFGGRGIASEQLSPLTQALGYAVAEAVTPTAVLMLGVGMMTFFLPGDRATGKALDPEPGFTAPVWAPGFRFALSVILLPWALATVVSGTFSPFLYFRF
ncbi:MAG: MBOAT family protein [Phycisphaerales bacterium]